MNSFARRRMPARAAFATLTSMTLAACSFTLDFDGVEGGGGGAAGAGGSGGPQGLAGRAGQGGPGGAPMGTAGAAGAGAGGTTGQAGSAAGGGGGTPAAGAAGAGGAPPSYAEVILASQPVAYYRFDDTTLDQVRSAVSGAPLGGAQGGPLERVEGAIAGDPSKAGHFDGGAVSFGDSFALSPSSPRTFELWLKPDAPLSNNEPRVFSKYEIEAVLLGRAGYFFSADAQGTSFTFEPVLLQGAQSVDAPAAPAGAFTYVAVTSDGATFLGLSINGQPSTLEVVALEGAGEGAAFLLGDGPDGEAFRGAIDEFAVYARVLPDEEIAAHYAAGVGSTGGRRR